MRTPDEERAFNQGVEHAFQVIETHIKMARPSNTYKPSSKETKE